MIELLQHYSLEELLISMILLALAIKSLLTFFDWAYDSYLRIFNKEYRKLSDKEQLEKRLQKGSQFMDALKNNQELTDDVLQNLSDKIDILIESDKDAIKAYITRQHHYFYYKEGWIDDFNLDCLQKRYKHYKDEGGNSFIHGFMEDLRSLPKQDPSTMFQEQQQQ